MFQQAEVTRGSLVSACRRMHLLHSGVSAVAELGKRMTCPTTKEQYLAIRQDHRRRRLGWSIFVSCVSSPRLIRQIFDAQLACLFGLPAQLPLCEVASPLPTAAPDAAANQASFKDIMECLLSGGKVSAAIEDMGLCCIAYALYRCVQSRTKLTDRLCLDVSPLERLFPGQGSAEYRYPNGTPYSLSVLLRLSSLTEVVPKYCWTVSQATPSKLPPCPRRFSFASPPWRITHTCNSLRLAFSTGSKQLPADMTLSIPARKLGSN